jgi:hypothetical protein
MQTTVNDVIGWLEPAINAGEHITLSRDENGIYCINLETLAKAECILTICNNKVVAHMRYGATADITSFNDILVAVHGCAHGQSYFNFNWLEVFKTYGMSDPRGNI